MEWLKDLDPEKILIWVVPGAFIALFRSYFLKGSFPAVGKDDVGAFIVGSVIYRFGILGLFSDADLARLYGRGWFWLSALGVVPALLGFGIGVFEASDVTGRFMRWCKIAMPSPSPSAWDTLFRAIPTSAHVIIVLKDGTELVGRWANGGISSSASSDAGNLDLYLGELGTVDQAGKYIAKVPLRGIYIAASEIRTVEVITGATP